jgi:hypothetical protein
MPLFLGLLLLLLGTPVQGLFAAMGLEVVLLNAGPPQDVADDSGTIRPNPEWNNYRDSIQPVFVAGSVILAIAGLVVGFFASKQKTFPSWYILITGVIPGLLLFGGWKIIHTNLQNDT